MEYKRLHSLHQEIGKLQILVSHARYLNLRRNIIVTVTERITEQLLDEVEQDIQNYSISDRGQ
jgi:hypothetical protein